MASVGVLIQSPLPACEKHEGEGLSVLCLTCIRRICDLCLKNEHLPHDWSTMARVIRDVKANAGEREKALLEILSDLRKASSEQESETEGNIRRIDDVEAKLISMISAYANQLRTRMREQESGRNLSAEITELEKTISFFSHDIKDAHDNVAFEMQEVFLSISRNHEKRKKQKETNLTFKEGDISKDSIENIFGNMVLEKNEIEEDVKEEEGQEDTGNDEEVNEPSESGANGGDHDDEEEDGERLREHVEEQKDRAPPKESEKSITEIASFTHGTERIMSIAPISEARAWIYEYDTRQVDCVDMTGRVTYVRKFGTYMSDFMVLDNNEFIYTVFGTKEIRRTLPSGKTQKVCSTSPLLPGGICRAHGGGLLVCLCECYVSQITPDLHGEVHHMKLSGKITKKYKRLADGRTKLFTFPRRVTQNINKDICVVDYVDMDFTSRLVVLTADGKVRFEYRGQPTLRERFISDDVCCDRQGRILVTDLYNYAVHQLSPDGEFLKLLLTTQDLPRGPKSLALLGENLWVGCWEGVVKVFKYT